MIKRGEAFSLQMKNLFIPLVLVLLLIAPAAAVGENLPLITVGPSWPESLRGKQVVWRAGYYSPTDFRLKSYLIPLTVVHSP